MSSVGRKDPKLTRTATQPTPATYAGTKFKQGITRGNGFIGEDVSHTVKNFQGIPKTSLIGDGFVRFEGVLTADDWLEADPEQLSNPRNVANGIGRRKDGEKAELITAIAFRAHDANGHPLGASERENLELLKLHGFTPVPHTTGSAEDVWKFHDVILADRANIPYWIDGIVVKVDRFSQQTELGETPAYPRWAVAIKFPEDSVETVIRSIDITVGHTGAIIPTAQFDTVRIGGTDVSSALLCNWNVMEALDVAVGDTVAVYKAGAIIPRIVRVTHRPADRVVIPRPTVCPVCGGPVGHKTTVKGKKSAVLYCLSEDCPAKVTGKIRRFVKSLEILGVGDEVIAALTRKSEKGYVFAGSPADLYLLKSDSNRALLASLVLGGGGRLGQSRADKIIANIEARRTLTLSEFLGSLGIDGLGKRRGAIVQGKAPGAFDKLNDWLHGKIVLMKVEGGLSSARINRGVFARLFSVIRCDRFILHHWIRKTGSPMLR